MRIESQLRSATGLSLILLLVLATASAPFSKPADHDDGTAHVEEGHGGHGHTVAEQGEQVRSEFAQFVVGPPSTSSVWDVALARTISMIRTGYLTHLSRDPPLNTKPRAPPLI